MNTLTFFFRSTAFVLRGLCIYETIRVQLIELKLN